MKAGGQRDGRNRLMRFSGWGSKEHLPTSRFLGDSFKSRLFLMKTSNFKITLPAFVLAAAISTNSSHAQTAVSPVPASALPPTPYSIVQRDANSQVWQRQTYDQAPDGSIATNIHKYIELATGLNHLVSGQWVASKEEIDLSPDGNSAAANQRATSSIFPRRHLQRRD